jgi:hypothetical protein
MKSSSLRDQFIEKLKNDLPDWKFIASNRHFRRTRPGRNWFVHISFINHEDDFDATLDVAVEFLSGKQPICILGASLGNIEGVGQARYNVNSNRSAEASAIDAIAHLKRIGLPFLERYSNVETALATLRSAGAEARLISPLLHLHSQQIAALESIPNAG